MMRLALTLVLVLALGWGLWRMVRRYERNQVYHPLPLLTRTPGDIDLPYRDIFFPSGRERLQGWHVPALNPRGTVIFCHGNSGNLSNCLETVEIFHRLGMNVFAFDYRGYGNSTGTPDEKGTYQDAEAAWDLVTGELGEKPERMVLFGRSLGGAVAVHLAAQKPAAALIVEASFPSLLEVAAVTHPRLPASWFLSARYEAARQAAGISIPKLFIHSRDDDFIPLELGEKLFRAAAEPKKFLLIRGSHGDGYLETGEPYLRALDDFLAQVLP